MSYELSTAAAQVRSFCFENKIDHLIEIAVSNAHGFVNLRNELFNKNIDKPCLLKFYYIVDNELIYMGRDGFYISFLNYCRKNNINRFDITKLAGITEPDQFRQFFWDGCKDENFEAWISMLRRRKV